MGWHSLCEHALPDKIISSGACGADRFQRPVIRVLTGFLEYAKIKCLSSGVAC